MYRKRLQELQKMEDDKQVLTRVANYPMVKDTWNRVSEVYQRGKDGSRIIRFCGGVAETSASLAYKASMPVIEKLPVGVVNDYAVQQLETLEEKYPTLVKPTGEVVDDLKTYSTSKLADVTTYGTNQFNRLAEVARLNAVLDVADAVVDKFLPSVEEVKPEPTPSTQQVVEQKPAEASTRVRLLSDKLKRRAFDNAMAKAGMIQKRSQEAVGKLMYTVDLIDYAQQNIRNMKMEDAQEKVKSIYDEITKESDGEKEVLPANANLEKKVIFVARAMTLRARSTFATVSHLSFALPNHARSAVNQAYEFTESMYQMFSKSSSYTEFSSEMLAELKQRLSFLEETANLLTQFILESTPVKWLAYYSDRETSDSRALTNQPASSDTELSEPESDPETETTDPDDSIQDTLNSTSNYDDVE